MLRWTGFAVLKFLANVYWVVHGNSLRNFLTGDKYLLKRVLEAFSIVALLLAIKRISPLPLWFGNKATSAVDPNVDTELEVTPGDLGQATVPTRSGNQAITHRHAQGWTTNLSRLQSPTFAYLSIASLETWSMSILSSAAIFLTYPAPIRPPSPIQPPAPEK